MSISLPGGQKHFGTESIFPHFSLLPAHEKGQTTGQTVATAALQGCFHCTVGQTFRVAAGYKEVRNTAVIWLKALWYQGGKEETPAETGERRRHEPQRNVADELNHHVWGHVNRWTLIGKFNTVGLRTTLCSWVLDIGLSHRQIRTVQIAGHSSSTLIMNTRAPPEGWSNNPLLTINRTKTLIIDFISHIPIYMSGAERYSCSHHLIKEHRSDQTTTNI